MNTPIYDFVRRYALSDKARFHMPGHKGIPFLGIEQLDITEIDGADVLYSPTGIIEESENNATTLFGSHHTFYSTEGSTLAIKAMLATAIDRDTGERPLILAARNSHKAFIHACALLDLDVKWMIPATRSHLCSCDITVDDLESAITACNQKPHAVYVTSPDYMGNLLDISALARVCHANGIPLLVDNAHGAYLSFLTPSLHPLALGADACCDSAHKTLPVLTGGAYLHVSQSAPARFKDENAVRNAFSLFASTSPSYLILQSLDVCNRYLCDGYRHRLIEHIKDLTSLKNRLAEIGYRLLPSEPLKLVIDCNAYGYTGNEIAAIIRGGGIECEFSDPGYIVFMSTPENSDRELERLWTQLSVIPKRSEIPSLPNDSLSATPQVATTIRHAILGKKEIISVRKAEGRICATPTVSCPPAIPIVVSGEIIERQHIALLEQYGIEKIEVSK